MDYSTKTGKMGVACRLARSGLLLGIVISLGLSTEVRAQQTISGTVTDASSGETLPYASILLEGTSRGTATNVDGYFVMVGVPADSVVLLISFLGYTPLRLPIDTRTLTEPLAIELEPITSSFEEDVVVVAERYQMVKAAEGISKVTVSPKDLAVLPTAGEVDIFRSLQLLPGISGTNEGSAGLFVRGGTPDQNLVLLDGMTVYHVDHFYGFFSAFNADAIKDVQVYKGGFPAQYGGRTSSVVDLTGRTGANTLGGAASINLLSASAMLEVPVGTRSSLLLSARRSYTDVLQTGLYNNIYETITGEDITPEEQGGFGPPQGGNPLENQSVSPNFYFYDLNAKFTYRPTNRDVLGVSFYNGQDHLDKSRDLFGGRGGAFGGDATQNVESDLTDLTDWGNVGVSGKWSRQWHPRFYSNTLVAYSSYFSDYNRDAFIERRDADTDSVTFSNRFGTLEDNRVDDFTFRLDNEWQIRSERKLSFGLQYTASDIRYDFTRDDTLQVLNRDQNGQQVAFYLQTSGRPLPRLLPSVSVTNGMRVAYYDQVGEVYTEPRLSVSIGLTDRIKLKGAYGEFNQFVARVVNENVTEGARDFWLLADGDDVGVQTATHYIAGLSYETGTWLFDAETYYKDLGGLTEFSLRFRPTRTEINADELFFTGDGTARGIEFLAQKKTGAHTGWLSYTLSEVEHTFEGINDGDPFPALQDQLHELKLVNSFELSQEWMLSFTWTYASGKPYTAPESIYTIDLLDGTQQSYTHVGSKNGQRLPAYHRLDTSLQYRFPIGYEGDASGQVALSLFNLYNRSNVWYKEYDLSESPVGVTDYNFLGFTPNISFRVDF